MTSLVELRLWFILFRIFIMKGYYVHSGFEKMRVCYITVCTREMLFVLISDDALIFSVLPFFWLCFFFFLKCGEKWGKMSAKC